MMKALINYYFVSLKVYQSNLCSNFFRNVSVPIIILSSVCLKYIIDVGGEKVVRGNVSKTCGKVLHVVKHNAKLLG